LLGGTGFAGVEDGFCFPAGFAPFALGPGLTPLEFLRNLFLLFGNSVFERCNFSLITGQCALAQLQADSGQLALVYFEPGLQRLTGLFKRLQSGCPPGSMLSLDLRSGCVSFGHKPVQFGQKLDFERNGASRRWRGVSSHIERRVFGIHVH